MLYRHILPQITAEYDTHTNTTHTHTRTHTLHWSTHIYRHTHAPCASNTYPTHIHRHKKHTQCTYSLRTPYHLYKYTHNCTCHAKRKISSRKHTDTNRKISHVNMRTPRIHTYHATIHSRYNHHTHSYTHIHTQRAQTCSHTHTIRKHIGEHQMHIYAHIHIIRKHSRMHQVLRTHSTCPHAARTDAKKKYTYYRHIHLVYIYGTL